MVRLLLAAVLLLILESVVLRCSSDTETMDQYCDRALRNVSVRQCCDMPHFLPDHVIELCRRRPLPPVPAGVRKPIAENCMAECALNVTRVLMNHRFRVEQARKVLLARTAGDTDWIRTIDTAIDKCYRSQVLNTFYLQYVAQNQISPQCIPSSISFLECTFAMSYRDCPRKHWHDPNETCFSLVQALNSCSFFFRGRIAI